MSNDLTAFTPEIWAREMQVIFFKENVAISLANTEFRDQLAMGDTVNMPYRSHLRIQTYTKGSDIKAQDVSGTNEQLTVSTSKVVPFYVDDIDRIQNKWDMVSRYAADAQRLLNNHLDQVILGEYSSANTDLYNDDVGGSGATTAIPVTVSNVQRIFTAAGRRLDALNIPKDKRFAAIGPFLLEQVRLYIGGKDTEAADLVGDNGKVMSRFGFQLYYTNNLAYTAKWTPADKPTDAGYITIAGVTFTFVDTIGTTAGNVLIGNATADTLDNLVTLINDPRTTTATGVALSDDDAWKLTTNNVVATDGTTYLGIAGNGDIAVATSETADLWSEQVQHALFGRAGATHLLVQKAPNVEFRLAEKRLGRYVYPWVLYGYKTFADMKDALVDVNIDGSNFT